MVNAGWYRPKIEGCVLYNLILNDNGTGKLEYGKGRSYILQVDLKWHQENNKLVLEYLETNQCIHFVPKEGHHSKEFIIEEQDENSFKLNTHPFPEGSPDVDSVLHFTQFAKK